MLYLVRRINISVFSKEQKTQCDIIYFLVKYNKRFYGDISELFLFPALLLNDVYIGSKEVLKIPTTLLFSILTAIYFMQCFWKCDLFLQIDLL